MSKLVQCWVFYPDFEYSNLVMIFMFEIKHLRESEIQEIHRKTT